MSHYSIVSTCKDYLHYLKLIHHMPVCLFLFFPCWCLHINVCVMLQEVSISLIKYQSIIFFKTRINWFGFKIPMGPPPEFHGTFWTTFEQHLWFPWNLKNIRWSSLEFNGICPDGRLHAPELHGIPSNLYFFPKNTFHGIQWIVAKFHGIPWNLINLVCWKSYF